MNTKYAWSKLNATHLEPETAVALAAWANAVTMISMPGAAWNTPPIDVSKWKKEA